MKANYGNWMPKDMIAASAAGAGLFLAADIALGIKSKGYRSAASKALCALLSGGAIGCGAFALYCAAARKAFSYDGDRKLSQQIIAGVAGRIALPEGGTGLDVGCGSGALTIACAKRNPGATMVGIDRWGIEYQEFSKKRCEQNAEAESISNVRFEKGDAKKLDFPDETFDAVTSNYVYHNILGVDKQKLLLETLRVLKKGGCFAIHDLMSDARYGDMVAFVRQLKAEGYEDVRLIDTTEIFFNSRAEARRLMLGSSTLLVGKK